MSNDLPRYKPNGQHKSLHITLPLPPSVNKIYYNTRGGGRRLTYQAENYIRDARALANVAIEEQRWQKTGKGIWLYMDIVHYFPDKRRRDAHNQHKILLDALESKVYIDDMYVMPRIQGVEYDKENPRIELKFTYQTESARNKGISVTTNKKNSQ